MSATQPRKHYHDIDAARSVLMFLSVALHSGTVYAPARPWITDNVDRVAFFDWLIFGLHLFITPTFFFVGGFFTVLLLKRRALGDFLWNRFLRTMVPLISIAVTFNMVELYLRYVHAGGTASPLGWVTTDNFADVWSSGLWQLHLWFLVSLIPMFFLSGVIDAVLPKEAAVRRLAVRVSTVVGAWLDRSSSLPFAVLLIALALVNFANYSVAAQVPGAYDLLLPGLQSWYKLVSEAPFFVLGIMAALSPRLLAGLVRWRGWMPWAAMAAFAIQPYAFPDNGPLEAAGRLFANQLVMWVLVLFVLQFFHRYGNFQNARTTWLADCALSMYLFHHCLVYVLGSALAAYDWPIFVEFALVTVLAAGIVMAFHEYVVRRVPLVRLLLNGKTDVPEITARRTGRRAQVQRGALGS